MAPRKSTQTTSPIDNSDFDKKFAERLEKYRQDFDIDSLNQSNDRALLNVLIEREISLEMLTQQWRDTIKNNPDLISHANELKKISDLIDDVVAQVANLQKTLSIDRKTRKTEQSNSIVDYIRSIKRDASIFLEKRLIKIYCPDCKVMVARYSPVHDHTAFVVSTECSQCFKAVRANRDARDVWFDVKDADWRRKYPVEIVQPKSEGFNSEDVVIEGNDDEDNIIIDAEVFDKEVSLLNEQTMEIPQFPGVDAEDMEIG